MSEYKEIELTYEDWKESTSVVDKEAVKQIYHKYRKKGIISKTLSFEDFAVGTKGIFLNTLNMNYYIKKAIEEINDRKEDYVNLQNFLRLSSNEYILFLFNQIIKDLEKLKEEMCGDIFDKVDS